MRSFEQKLRYLQSMSEHLNTQMLALIALRESCNDARRKIGYRGRRRRRRRRRETLTLGRHLSAGRGSRGFGRPTDDQESCHRGGILDHLGYTLTRSMMLLLPSRSSTATTELCSLAR